MRPPKKYRRFIKACFRFYARNPVANVRPRFTGMMRMDQYPSFTIENAFFRHRIP